MKLGIHVSIDEGIAQAPLKARRLGCNAFQMFSRNPRGRRKDFSLSDAVIKEFRDNIAHARIGTSVVHIPYVSNLAAARDSFHKVTIREFSDDVREADRMGINYFVTHMGSHKDISERRGLERVVEALGKILAATEGVRTKILLENTAGSGKWLGYHFKDFNFVFEHLRWTDRVGVCLDTAHAWAAGYKIDEQEGLEALFADIKENVGVERIHVVHLNDTQEKLNSRHDRHCAIGAGCIGIKGFYYILNHPFLKDIPFILETPKDGQYDDIRNLEMARKIYSSLDYDAV